MAGPLARLLSLVLPALALVVIVFGAYVRLSDAGLGCPDWPGCYGRLTVPDVAEAPHLADPEWHARPLEPGKAWREMLHRYLATALGAGIVLLALAAARARAPGRTLATILVPLVVLQGLLGMWTVTLLLKPLVVCLHLLGGLAILALLWWNLLACRRPDPPAAHARGVRAAATVALGILAFQVFLGGWTSANYAALACTDFPTCQGRWWPAVDFREAFVLWRGLGIDYEFGVLDTPARTAIHVAHRIGAAVTALAIAVVVARAFASGNRRLRPLAWYILAALTLQVGLGIANVRTGLPLPLAVAHNAGAALLLIGLVSVLRSTRPG
jgi:cytochrome c oxidase assembly protein subunit 15